MPRSANKVAARNRRRKFLKFAKGYWGRRKNVWTVAYEAIQKGWEYAYEHRKNKKGDFRAVWIQRINAAVREEGISYSKFINNLKNKNIELNRKTLADLAMNHPKAFKAVVDTAKA
ncbi:MAG: 50S ribosomal protein L20 [Bacteroidetes bacterium]|nr:50S ribosomal protein L20 [Bacteroidota bacterium]